MFICSHSDFVSFCFCFFLLFFFLHFQQNEPDCTPELPVANRALFLEKVRQSNAACQNGDFGTAVALYTDALALDPTNYILYSM